MGIVIIEKTLAKNKLGAFSEVNNADISKRMNKDRIRTITNNAPIRFNFFIVISFLWN